MRKIVFLILISLCTNIFSQTQPTSASDRQKGIDKRDALEQNSLVKNVTFRNVGPSIMSGRVTDISVDPENSSHFYVAYASGGLWETKSNGLSFTPVFDHEDVLTIGAIAVNFKDHIIWVGTGEVNSSRSSYAGNGIYKSDDNGKTWQYCGLPESQHIGRIVLHPTDKNIVYVGALGHLYSPNKERGVYKTTDGGKNWKQVLSVDENTGAVDLKMDPYNPSVLYASMWHRERRAWNFTESGTSSGIYKSTDAGNTWKMITGKNSGFPADEGTGRIGVSIFPGNTNILYAALDNQDHKEREEKKDTSVLTSADLKNITKEKFMQLEDAKLTTFLKNNGIPEKYTVKMIKDSVDAGVYKPTVLTDFLNDANNSLFDTPVKGCEVYRSDDGGTTWHKTNEKYLDGIYFTYGYYFGTIYVSPVNDKKIIVPGYPIVMSEDGGKTFKDIDGDNTHPDFHIVWFDPKNDQHIITGNDGGLNITYDDGKTWYKANNPPVGQFYSVTVDEARPYNVYGGLQDNGVWTGPSTYSAGTGWTAEGKYPYSDIYGGDGMQVQVDTRDNATVYTGFQFGYYGRVNKNTAEQEISIHPHTGLNEPSLRFNWQTPILLSKFNQDIFYYGADKFFRSMNKGEDLVALSGDLTNGGKKGDVPYGTITSIAESPLRFGLLYAGTDDGFIQMSQDDGYTWKKISGGLPQQLWVSRVTASNFHEGTIYASLSGYRYDNFEPYLFVSTDYGTTWSRIGTDLPFEPINVVKEDPANENILYVGTDNGLYVSLNRGKSFMAFNGGLPRVAVHDIAIQARDKDIVIGTHGRSIYIADLEEVEILNDTLLAKDIYVFSHGDIDYESSQGKKFNSYSDPYAASVAFAYYVKKNQKITVTVTTSDSLEIFTTIDTAEAGLNYFTWKFNITERHDVFDASLKSKGSKYHIEKADDENYYAVPGRYNLVLTDPSGHKATISVTIADQNDRHSGPSEQE